ncbi:hypothetical protein IFM46972_05685 [Aspergillus udagawae]|uniref:Uncharacterized protein n=1 Tax=Aspergillus udagawae TaxID=91492 RepID=A0A8H3NSX3_9EURO|nr:hypothetical protein IFM46972_05685 [Aspergillus udagawae]
MLIESDYRVERDQSTISSILLLQIRGSSARAQLRTGALLQLDLGAAKNNESVLNISVRTAAIADNVGAWAHFKSCHTLHTDKAGQGINVHVQNLEQVQGISIKAFRVLKLLAAFFVASAAGLRVDGREAGGANEGSEDGAGEHFAGSSWFV